MIPPNADTVLIRHGELGIKSEPVQARMETTLANNVKRMLSRREIEGDVRRERGRVFIDTAPAAIGDALDVATDTFGVLSASAAKTVPATEDAIVTALVDLADTVYTSGSFAVRARRAGGRDAHPFTSKGLEERGGSAIWEAVEGTVDPRVDLDDPDIAFFVECRAERAYVFLDREAGPGGFPIGTQGRTVPLISGGIDSPVAAWELMGRGCEIVPVYFDFEEFGGQDHVARAIESVRTLAEYVPDGTIRLYIVPFGEVADRLVAETGKTRMLSLRRTMFAVAEEIARKESAHSLVTGESIGQKSSQTGWNLRVTESATRLPVHRPLLDRDKQEIIDQAKMLGTFSTATIPAGCNRVAPTHPETHARLDQVREAEPDGLFADLEELVDRSEITTVTVKASASTVPASPGG